MGEVKGHTAILGRWLERLRDGDEAARSEVINHACVRLEALTRRMLRHYPRLRRWEQTGDVLQNAVVRLHRSLATVRPESPARFYGLAAAQIRRELTDLARHHFGPEGAAAHHHTDTIPVACRLFQPQSPAFTPQTAARLPFPPRPATAVACPR